jgi:amino acid adenylation domain-containing protein
MRPALIQEMFQQAVEKYETDPAIISSEGQLTYRELDQKANNLANFLVDAGVRPGTLIGIALEDPVATITAIHAILKVAAVYVPLDPTFPDARLAAMIEQTRPELFVIDQSFLDRVSALAEETGLEAKVVVVHNDEGESIANDYVRCIPGYQQYWNPQMVQVPLDPDQMCYVYFTSGSTGTPKGIGGRLKGIDHFIRWEIETLGLGEGTRVSQLLSLTFDGSVRDIFVALCSGGAICIPDDRQLLLDAPRLIEWLDRQRVNLIHCVPSLFRTLINAAPRTEQLTALKHIVMAGEPVMPADVKRWTDIFGERVQLVNLYGTSETTLAKFAYFIKSADKNRTSIPVGKPTPGARALVLDQKGRLCPPGTVGEIYIRTPYRSLGYINQPGLTSEVFVKNPFTDDPADIVHKTGDLGRILEDGNFEFLGRKDQQVKVRGMRVELAEIENILRQHEAVKDVAVIDREDAASNKFLCAYVVTEGTPNGELRELAASHLPDYMIPSAFIEMEKLPRTLSGKIDRRALPGLAQATESLEFIAPRTDIEEVVAVVWAEVLGLKRVSIRDNFFQLGGHSLLATQVVSRIREALQVEVPLSVLFQGTTVENFARLLVTHERKPGQVEKAARILKQIASMSAEETRRMLQDKEALVG